MMLLERVTLAGLLLLQLPLLAQMKTAPAEARRQSPPKPGSGLQPGRGQQVFEQNCSRCHDAPEGFAPQISGTVALHMRARANLSDADYKALRRFLSP
jgi:cytochrome c5